MQTFKYTPGIVCEVIEIRTWGNGTAKLLIVTDGYRQHLCRVPNDMWPEQAEDWVIGKNFLDL